MGRTVLTAGLQDIMQKDRADSGYRNCDSQVCDNLATGKPLAGAAPIGKPQTV